MALRDATQRRRGGQRAKAHPSADGCWVLRRGRRFGQFVAACLTVGLTTCLAPSLLAASAASDASGQQSPAGEVDPEEAQALARARTAFVEGRSLMQEERWSAAAEAFQRAAAIRQTPGLLYYVGYCQEQAGQFLGARESYALAGKLALQQPAKDVEALLPDALSRVEAQLGRLLLVGAPRGAALTVDGEPTSPDGELWLLPGEHELHLTASGYAARNFALRVTRGQTEKVDLSLLRSSPGAVSASSSTAADPVASPYQAEPRERHPMFGPAVYGGGSLLVLGLGAGITGSILASEAASDVVTYQQEVDALGGCDGANGTEWQVLCANLSTAASWQATSTGVAVAGYVSAGVGATLLVLGLTVWNGDQVQVSTLPVPGGTGLVLSGKF